MCMNCGCGQPHEDHGKPENITLEDLQQASAANGQTVRESAQHILETLQVAENEPSGDGGRSDGGRSGGGAAGAGLGQPAARSGGASGDGPGGRGTPASES